MLEGVVWYPLSMTDLISATQFEALAPDDWKVDGAAATAEFHAGTFTEAGHLAAEVAALCDLHNHHADLSISYPDVVRVTTSSHDVGGLSRRDLALAMAISVLRSAPPEPEPDTKDWTFVLGDGCPDCGFSPDLDPATTGERIRATLPRWEHALLMATARLRPEPKVWSPTEYAAHVRDVCTIFRLRLNMMLGQDNPTFANWDQDQSALDERYWEQQPHEVLDALQSEAEETADLFDTVAGDQWSRRGTRSNGTEFTIASFAAYFLHDVEHHLHDIHA